MSCYFLLKIVLTIDKKIRSEQFSNQNVDKLSLKTYAGQTIYPYDPYDLGKVFDDQAV